METPSADTPDVPFRPPRQDRSRKTLARIMDAALDLMAERGVEGTTVHDVVERAGSSVGSFYARFSGKEELLRHLEEHGWEGARERWDRALAEPGLEALPLERVVDGVVRALLVTWRAGARERRALGGRSGGGGEAERAFHEHVRRSVLSLLLARWDRIGHPDPRLAVELGMRAVSGTLRELESASATGGGGGPTPDDAALASELSRLWLGYLAVEGPPGSREAPPAPEPVEFFDIWG